MLRIAIALVCASLLLGYVVVGPGGTKSGAAASGEGAATTELTQLGPSSAPKLRSVDAIRKLAEQQGKALAKAKEAKYAKEKKEEAEDSPLPLDERRTRAQVVHISTGPDNEKILKDAEKEAEAQEEANAKAAERLLVTSTDEKKLMGEERQEVAARDARWRQSVAREAKDETESFSADQKSILSHHSAPASKKRTAKGVESHLKKQIDVITSGEGKNNARIAAVAQAAEAREERHLEEQVASITGGASHGPEAATAHSAPPPHKAHGGHAISKKDAEAAVRKLEAQGHGNAPRASAPAVPQRSVAPRPEQVGRGGHAISRADAEAAVRRLEAEHAGDSPSLHDSPEAKAARAEREQRLKREVGERAKEQQAYDRRAAAAAHDGPASRPEGRVQTMARGGAAAKAGSGGHHISMAAAEAAVKKLEAEGAGAGRTASLPHRRPAPQERATASGEPSGGHHISMAAAEAAVKKLQAEGK